MAVTEGNGNGFDFLEWAQHSKFSIHHFFTHNPGRFTENREEPYFSTATFRRQRLHTGRLCTFPGYAAGIT
jgi:hypothetical protein